MPRFSHYPKLTTCQNCETPTSSNFCPDCGQDCRDHRVTLRLLMVGLWNDLFTFDNRFWHSFVILLFKPGELTRRYMSGKRVRYIPPVRMYLFVSIIFFFIVSAMVANENNQPSDDEVTEEEPAAAVVDSLTVDAADNPGVPASALDNLPVQGDLGIIDEVGDVEVNDDEDEDDDSEDDGTMNGTMFGRDFEIERKTFISAIFTLAPKAMFLLLPIFALLLALIYLRSRRLYIEHLIFSLHLHTVAFILFAVALVSDSGWVLLIALLAYNAYWYLAMKRVYDQGWIKTWVKHFLLTGAYNIVLLGFMTVVMVGGIMLASEAANHPGWLGWIR